MFLSQTHDDNILKAVFIALKDNADVSTNNKRIIEHMMSDPVPDNSKVVATELIRMTVKMENNEDSKLAEAKAKQSDEEEFHKRRERETEKC